MHIIMSQCLEKTGSLNLQYLHVTGMPSKGAQLSLKRKRDLANDLNTGITEAKTVFKYS